MPKITKILGFENQILQFEQAQKDTEKFISSNPEIERDIDRYFHAYQYIGELIPQPLEKLGSGHFFPYIESRFELKNSIALCFLGIYRYSFIALRTVLEMGLLSVFWDRQDQAHIEIKDWFHARSDTPFKREIVKGLLSIENINAFCQKIDFQKKFGAVYEELSNYIHTKGYRYSSRGQSSLPAGLEVFVFSEATFSKWLELMKEVIEINCIVHLLKYPVALHPTPIEDKFGLDTPIGGFLLPWQADHIRTLFDNRTLNELQAICDADPEATKIAKAINDMPDITDNEFEHQLIEWDKFMIENSGYRHWLKQQRVIFNHKEFKQYAPEECQRFVSRARELAKWARKNGLIDKNKLGQNVEGFVSRV